MIIKTISTVNGTAQYHVLKKIESLPPFTTLTLTVDSYFDEDTYQAGGNASRTTVAMPDPDSAAGIGVFAEEWLVGEGSSIFSGGVIAADNSATLEAAQARAWVRVKACRAAVETGNFEYAGGQYQCDSARITGATTMALMAKMAGQPFSIGWTLADNTVRTLTGDQMIAMGAAAGRYVDSVFATARSLREDIAATSTIEEANLIAWPMRQEA
jgi:hypothetical protein